jgi:ROS/MUCR transcriptional regulator protein
MLSRVKSREEDGRPDPLPTLISTRPDTVVRISVLVVALFFAVGGFLAWRGSLDSTTYIVLTGVIGSIASIVGLIALASPRLTAKDIRDVEADLAKELSTTMQEVRDYEAQASASMAADALPSLIQAVYRSLATAETVDAAPAVQEPAVPVKKSVFPEFILDLSDNVR